MASASSAARARSSAAFWSSRRWASRSPPVAGDGGHGVAWAAGLAGGGRPVAVAAVAALADHLLGLVAHHGDDAVLGEAAAGGAPGLDVAAHLVAGAAPAGGQARAGAPGHAGDATLAHLGRAPHLPVGGAAATVPTRGSSEASRFTSSRRRPRLRSTFSLSPSDSAGVQVPVALGDSLDRLVGGGDEVAFLDPFLGSAHLQRDLSDLLRELVQCDCTDVFAHGLSWLPYQKMAVVSTTG